MEAKKNRRRLLWLLVAVGVGAIVVLALMPSRLLVETGRVESGPLQVTIDQEGETRAHDRFIMSAPVPGRLLRVELEDGDTVARDEIIARIDPLPLSQRERQEILGRVGASEAALRQAHARETHAREDREQTRRDRERAEQLARNGLIPTQALEQARNADITAAAELDAAIYSVQVADSEVKVARAGLVGLGEDTSKSGPLILLRSPVSGRVLRVIEKSERVLPAGTPILTLGDAKHLEIVADVLSTDAVKVQPGMPVLLEGWGGDHPIRARVRLVEPGGFTKVSALGIEEKRVNVISDFVDPPGPLGDGYRVETRTVIWSADKALKVPQSALFRQGQGWSVFAIEGGRAKKREVEIGQRNESEAQILRGLADGEEVILHPSNEVGDGVRVRTK
ncbi:MAG: efflux RND transporter periplasmic adaptor subunit [Acidobacteriia bacterium]|nr:efflux RND transporter periplasmic adaptor subunit [Terriglobia bacterium]